MPTTLKRTTIFLTTEQHERLRRIAFEQRTSMAKLIRDMAIGAVEIKEAIPKTLTGEEILDTLKRHKLDLKKYRVKRIGLYGSYVRGEQKRGSDIDLIVEFDMKAFGENFKGYSDNFMGLNAYLEGLFGSKIDLVTEDSVSPYIQPYIKKETKWDER